MLENMCTLSIEYVKHFEKSQQEIKLRRHNRPKFLKDLNLVLGELQAIQAFTPLGARAHNPFKWKNIIFKRLTKEELILKIQTNIDQY